MEFLDCFQTLFHFRIFISALDNKTFHPCKLSLGVVNYYGCRWGHLCPCRKTFDAGSENVVFVRYKRTSFLRHSVKCRGQKVCSIGPRWNDRQIINSKRRRLKELPCSGASSIKLPYRWCATIS